MLYSNRHYSVLYPVLPPAVWHGLDLPPSWGIYILANFQLYKNTKDIEFNVLLQKCDDFQLVVAEEQRAFIAVWNQSDTHIQWPPG